MWRGWFVGWVEVERVLVCGEGAFGDRRDSGEIVNLAIVGL